jgi:hypothetical protein
VWWIILGASLGAVVIALAIRSLVIGNDDAISLAIIKLAIFWAAAFAVVWLLYRMHVISSNGPDCLQEDRFGRCVRYEDDSR